MKAKKDLKADLPAHWKELILAMYSEGAHTTAVVKELGITRNKHEYLTRNDEEYREAVSHGRLLSEAWWTEQGRTNVTNKSFNNTLFIFMMKAVFKWKDTHAEKPKEDSLIDDEEKGRLLKKYRVDIEEQDSLN